MRTIRSKPPQAAPRPTGSRRPKSDTLTAMAQRGGTKRRQVTPRQAAVDVARVLHEAGHTAYFAGGCVRDALLGLKPNDYDIATDAQPRRVLGLFRNARYVGEAFGVVLVRLAGHDIEVATFRLESGYTDGRRPSKVEFTDALHDAQRRDFTINGLFEDPLRRSKADRVIDHVEGLRDLERGVIRAIGDPRERFADDYLRMLRAVRFAARLGFAIEPKTAKAIPPLADRLGRISRERIGLEVEAMLGAAEASQRSEAVRLIQRLHLDGPTLDEAHGDVSAPTVAALPAEAGYPTVLAAWLLDRHCRPVTGLPEFVRHEARAIVRRWRKALCLSNDYRNDLRDVLAATAASTGWRDLGKAKRKRLLAQPLWRQARLLLGATGPAGLVAGIDRDAATLLAEGVAPAPWVSGDDLIAMGRKPGPRFRRLLETAYDAQLDGTVRSRAEALAYMRKQQ